jgi:hypothetical protein
MDSQFVEFVVANLLELRNMEKEYVDSKMNVAPGLTERLFISRCGGHFNKDGIFHLMMDDNKNPMGSIMFAQYWEKEKFYKKLLLSIHPDKTPNYIINEGLVELLHSVNNTVKLMCIKSEKKPIITKCDSIKQLHF